MVFNPWASFHKTDAHDKDDEMRLFVGGGKNSGMMTVNPKEKQVEGIFQKAQETYGARSIDEVSMFHTLWKLIDAQNKVLAHSREQDMEWERRREKKWERRRGQWSPSGRVRTLCLCLP